MFLAPVVTADLLNLHARLHGLIGKLGLESDRYYRPGNWFPHCTMAMYLQPEQIGPAVELCRRCEAFRNGQLVEMGLVEYAPPRDICLFPLGMGNGRRRAAEGMA